MAGEPVAGSGRKRRRERMALEDMVEEVEEAEGEEAEWQSQNDRIAELEREVAALDGMLEGGGGGGEGGEGEEGGRRLTEKELIQVELDRAPEENEELFADEVDAGNVEHPSWEDAYAPRRPKYFNRVKTGYEWNKYNSTHYDADNPPPKVVHGYRFNIFYTDLVDSSKTPTFRKEPIPGNSDWAILRFHAGPPYLDVAFKIVNKEWERDGRFGFKAVFERGVLRLWFNLKRTRYRR